MLILGIDDAGRGPVIGPMILAGVLIDPEIEKEFKDLEVRDSKQVPSEERENLAEIIRKKVFSYHITITSAKEIDIKTKAGINLNRIEAIKTAEIINKINKGLDKIKVVIDCPSPNIEAWRNVVLANVQNKANLEIVCEHKADVNHVAVSAASIIAKSTREKEIEILKKKIGKDFGSGYPSDPVTCEFLTNHAKEHMKDGIFRETWQTWKDFMGKKEQKKLF